MHLRKYDVVSRIDRPSIETIMAAAPLEPFPIDSSLAAYPNSLCDVSILRLDKIHPLISGNKWFKLKFNIEAALRQGYQCLLSCGGPHSNHLHALACAGSVLGFTTVGFVRGYEHLPLTPTLLDCQCMGMRLIFLDKKTYLKRYEPAWCEQQANMHQAYWIPEGGNNTLGQKGCADIALACQGFDEIWTSMGSGCTFLGIAQALPSLNVLPSRCTLQGVMAIKGGQALAEDIMTTIATKMPVENRPEARIDCDSHLGGFGRCPESLVELIGRYDSLGLPLDPIYAAKMVAAFEQAWKAGRLNQKKRYVLIHSGGLQGRRGIKALANKGLFCES